MGRCPSEARRRSWADPDFVVCTAQWFDAQPFRQRFRVASASPVFEAVGLRHDGTGDQRRGDARGRRIGHPSPRKSLATVAGSSRITGLRQRVERPGSGERLLEPRDHHEVGVKGPSAQPRLVHREGALHRSMHFRSGERAFRLCEAVRVRIRPDVVLTFCNGASERRLPRKPALRHLEGRARPFRQNIFVSCIGRTSNGPQLS